jgi:hypothetical protein
MNYKGVVKVIGLTADHTFTFEGVQLTKVAQNAAKS